MRYDTSQLDEYAGVMAYAAAPAHQAGWSLQPLFVVLSVPAVAAVFAPLVVGTSPADVILEVFLGREGARIIGDNWFLAFLAAGFLLGFPILAWKARLALSRPGGTEVAVVSVVAKLLSIPVVIMPVAGFLNMGQSQVELRRDDVLGVIALALTVVTLALGRWIENRVARYAPPGHSVTAQMMAAYIANALFPIIAVTDLARQELHNTSFRSPGYLLTLAAVGVFTCELALMTLRQWPPRIRWKVDKKAAHNAQHGEVASTP